MRIRFSKLRRLERRASCAFDVSTKKGEARQGLWRLQNESRGGGVEEAGEARREAEGGCGDCRRSGIAEKRGVRIGSSLGEMLRV